MVVKSFAPSRDQLQKILFEIFGKFSQTVNPMIVFCNLLENKIQPLVLNFKITSNKNGLLNIAEIL